MKLQCTKGDFRKLIIACNESTSCFSCAFQDYCVNDNYDKGELIADIAEIVVEEESKCETSSEI